MSGSRMHSRQRSDAILTSCVILYLFTVCEAVPLQPTDQFVQVTLLESMSDFRVRREADSNLPDHLTFGIAIRDTDVVLRLTRARLLATVTCDHQTTEDASKVLQNAAVYTDTALGSAMIVKMAAGDYQLKGSFIDTDQEWSLEPHNNSSSDQSDLGTVMHRIFPMRADNISFVGDVVIDDVGDRSEIINKPEHDRSNHKVSLEYKQSTVGQHPRHRRDIVTHVIEVAMVVDYADFEKWQKYVGQTRAIPEMRLWYTYVAESINVRYRAIQDSDIAISVTITQLRILSNAQSSTFISSLQNEAGLIDGTAGLNAFRSWYPAQSDIPASDHYMLFTGLDIREASGIAFSGQVCTDSALSICENSFTGSVGGVAAHELGHSLSAVHDVDTTGTDACTDDDQFIMSTIFRTPVRSGKEGNPWKFSPCSIKSFKNYLRGVTCTLPENTSAKNVLLAANAGQRAGEVLSRDSQCGLSFRDAQSSFCQLVQELNGGMESLCGGMFCSIPNNTQGSCQTMVPQEFTSCSPDMWCVAGQCVNTTEKTAATAATNAQTTTASSEISRTNSILTLTTPTTASVVVVHPTTTTIKSSTMNASATTTQTTATSIITGSTSILITTSTASGTPTTHSTTTATREDLASTYKYTTQLLSGTTTPPTEEQNIITSNTTQQAYNRGPINYRRITPQFSIPPFRRCLAYLYRKDFIGFWNCLVNLASSRLQQRKGSLV